MISELESVRVLMVSGLFSPYTGGAEKQAEKLGYKLISKGAEITMITGRWTSALSSAEIISGIQVIRLPTASLWFNVKGLRKIQRFIFLWNVYRFIMKNHKNYDIIHCHTAQQHAAVAAIAAKRVGLPCIAKTSSSGLTGDIRVMRSYLEGNWLSAKLKRFISLIVYTSDEAKKEFLAFGIPESKLCFIPNGVEVPKINGKITNSSNIKTLLVVARLSFEKGIDVLLDALEKLHLSEKEIPEYEVLIAGDGPMKVELQSKAKSLEGLVNIKFLGNVSDTEELYSRSDIFILPSRCEGMSNALLEAMSYGLTCIVTNVGSNERVSDFGKYAIVVDSDNSDLLSMSILNVLEGSDNISHNEVQKHIMNNYSIDSVANQYFHLYSLLLKDKIYV